MDDYILNREIYSSSHAVCQCVKNLTRKSIPSKKGNNCLLIGRRLRHFNEQKLLLSAQIYLTNVETTCKFTKGPGYGLEETLILQRFLKNS